MSKGQRVHLDFWTWVPVQPVVPQYLQPTIGGAFVSAVPLAIPMIVLPRFWAGGLTEGAVKE